MGAARADASAFESRPSTMSTASALLAPVAPVSTGASTAASHARQADRDLFSRTLAKAVRPVSDTAPKADDPASIGTPGKRDGSGVLKPLPAATDEDQSETEPSTEATDASDRTAQNTAFVQALPVVVQPTPTVAGSSGAQADATADAGAPQSRPLSGDAAATHALDPQHDAPAATETMQAAALKASATLSTSAGSAGLDPAGSGQASGSAGEAAKTAAKMAADAQVPTAQVQVAVTTVAARPAVLTSDAAVAVAVLVGDAKTDAQSEDTAAATSKGDAPTSLRPGRHEGAQRAAPAPAPAPVEASPTPGSTSVEIKTLAQASAGTSQSQSTADAKTASKDSTPAEVAQTVDAEGSTPTVAAGDTPRAQSSAAADRSSPLSTLSHATVETTAHLAAQIARRLDGRSTRFDMVLTPEDLGRVDVSLEIGKDGQLSARLAFDNPAAAADLRGRADELRRQLQDAGFQLAGDALEFSQRDPSAGGGGFDRQQQRNALFAGGDRLAAQADTTVIPAPGVWTNHSLTPERVDLKV
nr:flagellar hook-length control protein FliK [uncultured Brevundimonas sp.]